MRRLWIGLVACMILYLVACGGEPTPTPDVVATEVAREQMVAATLTASVNATGEAAAEVLVGAIETAVAATATAVNVPEELTPEDEEYVYLAAQKLLVAWGALDALMLLWEEPDLRNRAWRIDVVTEAAIVKKIHTNMQALHSPESMAGLHEVMEGATEVCDAAMDLVKEGIDSSDPARLTDASLSLVECREELGIAFIWLPQASQ